MRIESINLKHTLHFSDIHLGFHYHNLPITLILGQQSSGKTTLVRFCYQALTWFSARYKDSRAAGLVMLDHEIMHKRLQSKIDIHISFPEDIGQLTESSSQISQDTQQCTWQLYKTLNSHGVGLSKVETQQLEAMITLYQNAQHRDALVGLPLIAYYPAERFVNDINLISKNNPAILHPMSAYDLTAIPFTTFSRFFEWFREINDIENAKTSNIMHQVLKNYHADTEFFFPQTIAGYYANMATPATKSLQKTLKIVLPEINDLYIEYHPKLQLMVQYQKQHISFQQLSNSTRNIIALVGDIVRRLCLLNPNSLYPCQEGEGILMIDAIDHQLDPDMASVILPRLHEAFPRLQIIATGTQEALLENAEGMQCLRLAYQHLHPIQPQQVHMESLYAQLGADPEVSIVDPISQSASSDQVEQCLEYLQQLSPEQQQIVLQRLQEGDTKLTQRLSSN
jgi:predicted ATP-binding protein involved in virulence